MNADVPIAWVCCVMPNTEDAFLVVVACPFCGGTHMHGDAQGNVENDTLGTRLAHCTPDGPGLYALRMTTHDRATALLIAATARCKSLTASGRQCSRRPRAQVGTPLCAQHAWAPRLPEGLHYQEGPALQSKVVDLHHERTVRRTD